MCGVEGKYVTLGWCSGDIGVFCIRSARSGAMVLACGVLHMVW